MVRSVKTAADPIERRGRVENDRNLAASNAAAEAAGLGVAAGSLILGTLLSHRSNASEDRHHNLHVEHESDHTASSTANHHSQPTASVESSSHTAASLVPHEPNGERSGQLPSDMHASSDGDVADQGFSAVDGSQKFAADHHHSGSSEFAADTTKHHQIQSIGDITDSNHGISDIFSALGSANSPIADAISGVCHVVTDAVHNVTSSLSGSLTNAFESISSTLSDLTHSLSGTTDHASGSPVDLLGDPAFHLLDINQSGQVPSATAEVHQTTSPVMTLLGSLPASLLGGPAHPAASNNTLPENFGSAPADMHPSIAAYGDLAQPIHIGFAGQSFAQTLDPHDISTHGLGSTLHGFV